MGWRSRGYFPHLEGAGLMQHVVFHLADSLPEEVVARLDRGLKQSPAHDRDLQLREKVDAWLDAGRGSCVLGEPAVAKLVQDSLLSFHGQRYRLLEWAVMPNHVHVLLQTQTDWSIGKIVSSWKSYTGRRISERLKVMRGESIDRASTAAIGPCGEGARDATLERGVPKKKEWVWHREYWDRYMRDEEQLQRTVRYIRENPVQAGLAKCAEDWPWGSAYPENTMRLNGDK